MGKILLPILVTGLLLGGCRASAGRDSDAISSDSIAVVDSNTVVLSPERTTKLHIDGRIYKITPNWYILEKGKGWGINGTITEVVKKKITIYGVPYCYRSDFFSQEDIADLGRRGIALSDPHKTLTAHRLLCDTLCGSGQEVLQAYETPDLSQEQIDRLSRSGIDAVRAYNSPFLSKEQADYLNSSARHYGMADIWIVTYKAENDALKYFVILDKITLAETISKGIQTVKNRM